MFNIAFCAYCVHAKNSSSNTLYIDISSAHCISVHCSQAVLVDRTIYISGQLGMDPSSGQLVPGGVAAEAKQASHFPRVKFCSVLPFNLEEY